MFETGKEPVPQEFRAHSAFKTNERLHEWFIVADNAHHTAYIQPTLRNLAYYAGALDVLYKSVFMIFGADEHNEIDRCFSEYYAARPQNEKEYQLMLNQLRKIDYYIRGFLQLRKYFFKLDKTESKNIEEALKKIKDGSGVFTGEGVSRVPSESDQAPAE